jgi:hypothetical protein
MNLSVLSLSCIKLAGIFSLACLATVPALATPAGVNGAICVKYGPCPLDVSTFSCGEVVSSFIGQVCYDEPKRFMVIELDGTWYPYCAIDADTVAELLAAVSKGTFYNQRIRSHGGQHGPFDCRDHPMPSYP